MSDVAFEKDVDGNLLISGELTHQSVPQVLKMSREFINNTVGSNKNLAIDLGGVTRSDSAGVALLIEWMRQAKINQRIIQFKNIPAQMREIANVSGVDKLLAV